MNFSIYRFKQDQGRLTRGIAFFLYACLLYYGCWTLYYFLHWPWAKDNLIEWKIPIINQPINLALVIACALMVFGLWVMVWFLNQPKFGSLLIETETEMKKVTWPSWNDSFNSSLVVLVAVIFFMIYLGVADIVLNFIFSKIVFGGLA
ncbi:MAG: preprotein translocase subunit SecE [Planctomycetota bacterium]|jgi:preprotein translocase SecE subunit